MMKCKSILAAVVLLCIVVSSFGQITSGKIVYERKTNLYKKYKSWTDIKEWIKEDEKTKTDMFELYFNDTASAFVPQESDLKEEMGWATSKSYVYQYFKSNKRFSIKTVWGEKLYVDDTLWKRKWKITDSKRVICGYTCRKAIWQANDTTKIYAWYSEDITAEVGPESYYGLPGAILGLATEDGGVIYFAKSVEVTKPEATVFNPKKGRNKIYSSIELRTKLEKDYGKEPWGKVMISNLFGIW
jgi:hypothetical protein